MSPLPELAFEQLGTTQAAVTELVNVLVERGKAAKRDGYLLEAISIRLYLCEFYLRVVVVAHTGRDFDPGRNMTFGRLIERAADCHLEEDLLTRLRRFNKARNNAVHGLLEGRVAYADLEREVFDNDPSLLIDLSDWLDSVYFAAGPRGLTP